MAPPSEADYGITGEDFHYDAAGAPDDVGFDKGTIEDVSALAALKSSTEQRKESFFEKLAFWESTKIQEVPGGARAQIGPREAKT